MHFSNLNPAKYIQNSQETQRYACSLCFELTLSMRKCTGPCQKYFCLECLRQKAEDSLCPFCLQTLQVEKGVQPTIIFKCPSVKCSKKFIKEKQFLLHASKCQFVQNKMRQQFKFKSNYRCICGEPLSFSNLDENVCYECSLEGDTGSQCQECFKQFCTVCRRVPLGKNVCIDQNHPLLKNRNLTDSICDLCQMPFQMLALKTGYEDRDCDLDICSICYDGLDSIS